MSSKEQFSPWKRKTEKQQGMQNCSPKTKKSYSRNKSKEQFSAWKEKQKRNRGCKRLSKNQKNSKNKNPTCQTVKEQGMQKAHQKTKKIRPAGFEPAT